jgi:hypothetical protein
MMSRHWKHLPAKGPDLPQETKPSHPAVERHPLTKDQKRQLEEDLKNVEDRVNGILILMRAAYGEESQPAIRAEEVWGALQRLKWTLERPSGSRARPLH